MAIKKLPGGVEDLVFGMGTIQQQRKGSTYVITQVNASHIPFSASVTVAQELDRLGNTLTPIQGNLDAHIADKDNPHEVTITDVGGAPLDHQHQIEDVDFLQPNLDDLQGQINTHIHDDRYYRENEYIAESLGAPHAHKPILLNSQGVLDPSFFDTNSFYYVAGFAPAPGFEYPDTVGHEAGAFWSVEGVNAVTGYTFVDPGVLLGKTVHNGDFMVWGSTGWAIMQGSMNPELYYKLDGTQALTAPFAAGGQVLDNLAPGIDVLDAATVGQVGNVQTNLETHIADGANPHGLTPGAIGAEPANGNIQGHIADVTTNPHNVTATQSGAEPADPLIQAHLIDTDNPHNVNYGDVGAEPVNPNIQAHIADVTTNPHAVTASQVGAEPADPLLQAHLTDTANPHTVTKAQVGLSDVDNTSDLAKPISTATQAGLDTKFDIVYHVEETLGLADAGKPIVLTAEGKLHPSISGSGLYPVSMYTPVVGSIATEYPDTTGESFGAYWGVTTDPILGFTFTVGDLIGQTVFPNDSLIYGSQGWGVFIAPTGAQDFYRLDGTIPISAPFAGGSKVYNSMANGVVPTDGATLGQVQAVEAGAEPANANIQAHIADVTTNPHAVTAGQVGAEPSNANIQAHIADVTTNPHAVTADQIGAVKKSGDTMTGSLSITNGGQFNGVPIDAISNFTMNIKRFDGTVSFRIKAGADGSNPILQRLGIDGSSIETTLSLHGNGNASIDGLVPTAANHLTRKDYVDNTLGAHTADVANPHAVTKAQVGLGYVINTGLATNYLTEAGTYVPLDISGAGDMFKATYDLNDNGVVDNSEKLTGLIPSALPVSTATQTALDAKLSKSGGTMTGEIILSETVPLQGLQTSVAYNLVKLGSASINFGDSLLPSVANGGWDFAVVCPTTAVVPTVPEHLVNKAYADSLASNPPAGVAFDHYGATAPAGALSCDGQEVAQATYPALYAAIGDLWATTGGAVAPVAGNFRLPPQTIGGFGLYSRGVGAVAVGTYESADNLSHAHTADHSHTGAAADAGDHTHTYTDYGDMIWAGGAGGGTQAQFNTSTGTTSGGGTHGHSVTVDSVALTTVASGNTEARPHSITVLKCIWTGE